MHPTTLMLAIGVVVGSIEVGYQRTRKACQDFLRDGGSAAESKYVGPQPTGRAHSPHVTIVAIFAPTGFIHVDVWLRQNRLIDGLHYRLSGFGYRMRQPHDFTHAQRQSMHLLH